MELFRRNIGPKIVVKVKEVNVAKSARAQLSIKNARNELQERKKTISSKPLVNR